MTKLKKTQPTTQKLLTDQTLSQRIFSLLQGGLKSIVMKSQCRLDYGLNQNALEFWEFRSKVHRFSPYAPYKSKIKKRMYFFFLLICKDLDEMLTFQFAFSVETL